MAGSWTCHFTISACLPPMHFNDSQLCANCVYLWAKLAPFPANSGSWQYSKSPKNSVHDLTTISWRTFDSLYINAAPSLKKDMPCLSPPNVPMRSLIYGLWFILFYFSWQTAVLDNAKTRLVTEWMRKWNRACGSERGSRQREPWGSLRKPCSRPG